MSKQKHTPGPWKAVRQTSSVEITAPLNELTICELYQCNRSGLNDEIAANARLITTAPGLLEALQNLVEFCVQRIPDASTEELGELVAKAQSAIDKATGVAE